jgi:putative glutamine transport system substrate-binding protein
MGHEAAIASGGHMVYRSTLLGLAFALGCSSADAQTKPPADELYDVDTAARPAPAAGSPLDRMVKTLHARVCIRVDVAPFGYFGGAGPTGFDVALAAEIVDQLSIDYKAALRPEWVVVTAGERIKRVQDDACDLAVVALSYTKQRADEVATSKVYARTDKVLVAASKITRKTPVVAKLEGTTGSAGIAGASERSFRTYQEIIHAMEAGEVDYLAADRPIAEHLVRSVTRPYAVTKTLAANAESYVVAMKKGNAELTTAVDRALETIARSGKLALLERRWL